MEWADSLPRWMSLAASSCLPEILRSGNSQPCTSNTRKFMAFPARLLCHCVWQIKRPMWASCLRSGPVKQLVHPTTIPTTVYCSPPPARCGQESTCERHSSRACRWVLLCLEAPSVSVSLVLSPLESVVIGTKKLD